MWKADIVRNEPHIYVLSDTKIDSVGHNIESSKRFRGIILFIIVSSAHVHVHVSINGIILVTCYRPVNGHCIVHCAESLAHIGVYSEWPVEKKSSLMGIVHCLRKHERTQKLIRRSCAHCFPPK